MAIYLVLTLFSYNASNSDIVISVPSYRQAQQRPKGWNSNLLDIKATPLHHEAVSQHPGANDLNFPEYSFFNGAGNTHSTCSVGVCEDYMRHHILKAPRKERSRISTC